MVLNYNRFSDVNPHRIISEMNKRLMIADLAQINGGVGNVIKKKCKKELYKINQDYKFLVGKKQLGCIDISTCQFFQRAPGKKWYIEVDSLNIRYSAVIVSNDGTIYRYMPNYNPEKLKAPN